MAIVPLTEALELAFTQVGEGADITISLPEPRRTVILPADSLLPSPSGDCVRLNQLPRFLPLVP